MRRAVESVVSVRVFELESFALSVPLHHHGNYLLVPLAASDHRDKSTRHRRKLVLAILLSADVALAYVAFYFGVTINPLA
ncbi:MAG: hypothetical protein ACYTCN_08445 [Planctomycetota bacterium]|jgi:hypothetical protein